nr:uncharacterized protein LOC117222777 [Megalopta genalis]XP_033330590.1 uncharacterized protein LOC117222777 [Megalopta genalis]
MGGSIVSRLVNRYWQIVLVPTVLLSCVYADWSHTQKWKKKATKDDLPLNN